MYFTMMDPEEKQPTAYKIICAGENEEVVGLHILGQGSSEILQGFGVAIKMGATKKDFDNCVVSTPPIFLSRFVVRPWMHMRQCFGYRLQQLPRLRGKGTAFCVRRLMTRMLTCASFHRLSTPCRPRNSSP
jgi:hypothetical protein